MSRVDLLRAELEEVGADTFCDRRIYREDMPVRLMRKLQQADLIPETDLHRVRATRTRWGPRRLEVLRLIAEGQEDVEIAALLFVSPYTAKANVKAVYAILGARNRAHAVHLGWQQGLIEP